MRALANRMFGALAALATVFATSMPLQAQQAPLPAFEVEGPQGPVSAAVLNGNDKWLLVYAVPAAVPSDRLLEWFGQHWTGDVAARVVIVMAGDRQSAANWLRQKAGADVADALWYTDPDGKAWEALQFNGAIGLAGIQDGRVDWKLDGVIADPTVIEPAVKKWLDMQR